MKRNFTGYGKEKPKIFWPQENKIAVSFVVNIEEGAELSISSGDSQNEHVYENNKIKILLQLYQYLLLEHINLNTLYLDNQVNKEIKDIIIDISKLKSAKKTTEISNYLLYKKTNLLTKIQYVKLNMLKN